ncbi:MAG: Nitrite extrusion protein [Frankiales bacterium]|nr:Nitrite extrusion protein [Frankiales bacterium]
MTATIEAPTTTTSKWIEEWDPENPAFWEAKGRSVARRNLLFSVLAEHIGFSVWTMWSVLVLFLGIKYGFPGPKNIGKAVFEGHLVTKADVLAASGDKFLLISLPALVGSMIRIPYTFAVAKFGGRNWTVISALLLLIPLLTTYAVLKPGVSFSTLLLCGALAGVGGGNFASSMANINAFYPDRLKGRALGLNAGGGNIGVAAVQLVALAVIAVEGKLTADPRDLIAIYIPLVLLAALGAWLAMDNLSKARNAKHAMRDVAKDRHTWVMSFLYIGTFGSFIGFGFAFGQVLTVQFKADFPTPLDAAYLTFLGPLVGSLIRPVGGLLADKLGGARVTAVNFLLMGVAASVVLAASYQKSLPLYLVGFTSLFVFSGIGNGSTYKMIPAIFARRTSSFEEARRLSAALIGVAGAIGAFGGVLVNVAFRQSFLSSGNANGAYTSFIAFYAACLALTYLVYLRPGRELGRV